MGFDGRVFGCCGDLNGEVVLGDMHELSLQDVWNCDKIIEMRRLHLQKRHMDIPLCRECDAMYVRAHPVIRDVFELVTGRWNPL